MKVRIKGITGLVLNMEAVVDGGCGVFDITGYVIKILADDGTRIEFGVLPIDAIEVIS